MLRDKKTSTISSRLASAPFLARFLVWSLPPIATILIAVFDPSTKIERRQTFDRAILTKELGFDSFNEVYAAPHDAWQQTKYTIPDRAILSDHHVWRRHEIPAAKDNQPEDYVA
ncbi:MAG: hypothetical protein FJ146_19030, partial [Deltaproteobacteria bacterium]|nr:hypothetical protein [Deltaproteobacteria bacterium]